MQFEDIQDIANSLIAKAKENNFLQQPVDEVEIEANKFIDEFTKEHDLTAHTISPFM